MTAKAAAYREAREFNKEADAWIGDVERYIGAFTETGSLTPDVAEVIRDAAAAKGKMLRPKLLMFCASLGPDFKAQKDRLSKLAAMIELVHMSSLIHDDIVDDAPERRGLPSVQSKYGKKAAVYAGDFLMSRISYHMSREDMNRAGAVIAETIEKMCVGEMGQARCMFREDVTAEDYLHNIHGKTAALFMAACHIGAEESGCNSEVVRQLEHFGECFGIMFQLRDDLLDYTSDKKIIGKEVMKDFREGIYTYPVLYVLGKRSGRQRLLPFLRANADGTLTERQLKEVREIVREEGGIEAARAEIRARLAEAEACIRRYADEEGPARKILRLIQKLGVEVNP